MGDDRIFVGKNETLKALLGRMALLKSDEIILVVPIDSKLSAGVSIIRTLRREADKMSKLVTIESVDEKILGFAESAQLAAVHPFLSESGAVRSMSDIVTTDNLRSAKTNQSGGITHDRSRKSIRPHILRVEPDYEDVGEFEKIPITEPRRKKRLRRWIFAGVTVIILGLGWTSTILFVRAEVTLNFRKQNWEDKSQFMAAVSVTEPKDLYVPGQILKQTKNTTRAFLASGRANVKEKATGQITIYNAYSSTPQSLVANTRFETKDGKVFRLANKVLVPGAKTENGKIIPTSIKAKVIADKPGPEYNIGPVDKLAIPGFNGTPKYNGFYGALEEPLKGGSIGERPVPTADDIASAKTQTSEALSASFESVFLTTPPDGLRIITGASKFTLTKIIVDESTDENGNFNVFGEAEFSAMAFREKDAQFLILDKAIKDSPLSRFEKLDMNYISAKPNFNKGELVFEVESVGVLVPDFDGEKFRSEVLGKTVREARSIVLGLPRLANAKVSIMPFWIKRMPEDAERVKITLN